MLIHDYKRGVIMGYQESFLFCKTKKDVMNLCRVLNKAQEELDSYGVYAFAVGKYKKPLHISIPFVDSESREFSKKGYFVWWGGERHPIQSGNWLYDYISEHCEIVSNPILNGKRQMLDCEIRQILKRFK